MSEPKRSMQAVLAGFGGQGILFAGKILSQIHCSRTGNSSFY